MRRTGVMALALVLLCAAQVARADGTIDLNWDDCYSGIPNLTKSFPCTTVLGSTNLVASFVPPPGITALDSVSVRLRIELYQLPCLNRPCVGGVTVTYPDWWDFGPGSCRENAVRVVSGVGISCVDPWSSGPLTGVVTSFTAPYGIGSPIRELTASIGESVGNALDPGYEYEALALRVNHLGTTGPGACTGCLEHMWILLEEVTLHMKDGSPSIVLTRNDRSNGIGWQGDAPVPAQTRTWGSVKALYR